MFGERSRVLAGLAATGPTLDGIRTRSVSFPGDRHAIIDPDCRSSLYNTRMINPESSPDRTAG